MQQTYTQLHLHLVFAVKKATNRIPQQHLSQLERSLTGITKNLGQKLLYVKCLTDHTHLFIGWETHQSLSEIASKTKTATTAFIKKQNWNLPNYAWQKGFSGFSYSHDHIDLFIKYLSNQDAYHQKHSFKEEYMIMLQQFDIPYDDRYVFEFYE